MAPLFNIGQEGKSPLLNEFMGFPGLPGGDHQ